MPNSFSQDGALGAGGFGDTGLGGMAMNDPGMSASGTPSGTGGSSGSSGSSASSLSWDGRNFADQSSLNNAKYLAGHSAFADGGNSSGLSLETAPDSGGLSFDGMNFADQNAKSIYKQRMSSDQRGGGAWMYSEGGAIDENMGDDSNGSPGQNDAISRALQSVTEVLNFGRQRYGLSGGGDNEGNTNTAAAMPMIPGNQSNTPGPYKPADKPAGQKQAAMPAIPGNPSESGIQRPQPMPGPLPPTSNPFGKRADAGSDNADDQSGAIDTDEDAA